MTRIKYMPGHWGMHGFNRHPSLRNVHVTVNVSQLSDLAEGADNIDLGKFGFDKLLGSGQLTTAITVTVAHASAKAVEKVEAAGGSVTLSEGDGAEWEEE